MENKLVKYLLKTALLFVCILGVGVKGSSVQAEEIEIVREGTGDLEQLEAIHLSDEEMEEWQEAISIQNTENRASTQANQFLRYGSSYGYQDMLKRSNGAGRQYTYRQLEELSKNFTVNQEMAVKKELNGAVYYMAGTAYSDGYNLTDNELVETYFTFRHDNPQYFWLANRVLFGSGRIIVLTYDEFRDGEVRGAALEEIVQTAQNVYRSKISSGDNNYQKVLKLHDSLIADIEYASDMNRPTAHSIAGAMTSERSAVCEGYAKVMQVMMNGYNVTNIYVTGTANGGGHAWNMVCMNDGKYYWLDATWDDQKYEQYRHNYFLVGNGNFTDHSIDLPVNSGTSFLYELPAVPEADYVYDPDNQQIVKGDINEDGATNLLDLMQCLNHVAKKATLAGNAFQAADVDGNGKVDLFDLMRILNYVAKKTAAL